MGGELVREVFKGLDHGVQAEVLKQVMGWEDCLKALSYCAWPPLGFPGATRAGACWAQTEDPSGCGAASPSQGWPSSGTLGPGHKRR